MGLLDKLKFLKGKPNKDEDVDYSALGLSTPTLGPPEDMKSPPPNPMEPARERDLPRLPASVPAAGQEQSKEYVEQGNIRAKLDLMATQLDSILTQQETISQRVAQIEQNMRQILEFSRR